LLNSTDNNRRMARAIEAFLLRHDWVHSSAKFRATMAALRQPSTHVPACGSMTRNAAAARLFEIINAAPEYHEPFTNTPAAS
tara:strand:- start:470 stop:715 length:246 start_codon:yes stop_codon:yes gene_type:complete